MTMTKRCAQKGVQGESATGRDEGQTMSRDQVDSGSGCSGSGGAIIGVGWHGTTQEDLYTVVECARWRSDGEGTLFFV